jgi:hypothetical protein
MNNMKTKLFTAIALACGMTSFGADFNLKVNLSDSIRQVTHCASGSLYGVTEEYPIDIQSMINPLKCRMFCQPGAGGHGNQHPYGDAIKVAERLKGTDAQVQITLPDILPYWPYKWPGLDSWLKQVEECVNRKKNSGLTNFHSYVIWNEPYGTWNDSNGDFHSTVWKPTYDLLRKLDPDMPIVGPAIAYYSQERMEKFLKFCIENNCMPDIICWHQWGSGGLPGAVENIKMLEQKYKLPDFPICINEYCAGSNAELQKYEGCPGYSVPFIAKFERYKIESASISWWFTQYPGRLGSLLTPNNEKGGGWHLYKWYGDMEGYMASVTPPNDKSEGLDGFAAVNKKMREASIILGGNNTGSVDVIIDGLPDWMGGEVEVITEVVTWENKDKAVAGPQTLATETYTINHGQIIVPVNVTSNLYAYRLYITPNEVIPRSPFLSSGAISIPGTIEAEYFDNGSEGIAYHDKDRQNRGEGYRLETGVDVYALKDKENEYAVGYAQNEEWLDYTIYIEKEGYYNVSAILSSGGEQSGIQLLLDGENITDTLKTAPNNEDWESYLETTANTTTKLPQGEHTLRLNIVGDWINIDKLIFETSDPTALQLLDADKNDTFEIYDSLGRKSGEIVTTQVNIAKKLKELGFGNGIYILQSSNKVLKVIVD